eukprot:augustus_masked-scaffold_53-processed-gene-0.5-mRNA-1 protein AED:1.00 eAED:1.00 QI:0/0/0/0/1/1/2/0/258
MLPCGIHCFLNTINFGCSMMESESSKDVVKGLKLLGLQDALIIMTDGSKALEAAVEELGADSNSRIKMKHVIEVVEREGLKLQSSTCETWTNQRFLCRHYARYCDRKRIQYMDIDHLPARWRYQEHSLFKQALREMGREVDGPRGCIEFKVKVPPVNAAYIPRKPETKYSKLLTACKALCEEVKSSNEGWKKSYAAVLKMTAALRENPDGNFGDLDQVSEESGIMFESPRKRVKRRKGKGEKSVTQLDFSQLTFLTDE